MSPYWALTPWRWCGLFLIVFIPSVGSSTPNIIISADGTDETWFGKRAEFGSDAESLRGTLVHTPDSDRLLCQNFNESRDGDFVADPTFNPPENPFILMTPRGSCTFERKAWVAQEIYGAAGILVYDNLAGRYSWNETTQRVIFPTEQTHYECENGFGVVTNLSLDPPPYDPESLDKYLDRASVDRQCNLSITTRGRKCESQLCLVTSHKENSTDYPVCCAWDTHITMIPDPKFEKNARKIFGVMITIRQSETFLEKFLGKRITFETRPYNSWNPSMFFLWILATAITAYACWYSAQNYRYYRAKLRKIKEKKNRRHGGGDDDPEAADEPELDVDIDDDGDVEEDFGDEDSHEPEKKSNSTTLYSLPNSKESGKNKGDKEAPIFAIYFNQGKEEEASGKDGPGNLTLFSLPPPEKKRRKKIRPPEDDDLDIAEGEEEEDDDNDEPDDVANSGITTMEMSTQHVVIFVLVASCMLLFLFFFKFYNFVTILYAIGAAGSVSFLIFAPIMTKLVPKLGDDIVDELNKKVICSLNGFDIISQGAGYIWAAIWVCQTL